MDRMFYTLYMIVFVQIAFELMSVVAVVTNCALVFLSPQVQEYSPRFGPVGLVMIFIIAEVSIVLYHP